MEKSDRRTANSFDIERRVDKEARSAVDKNEVKVIKQTFTDDDFYNPKKEVRVMKKLKPCPFCGKKPNYSASCQDGYTGRCSIYCSCGASMNGYETKAEVLKTWNTRKMIPKERG
jgi:Lar family restriction alleviation protein